ncbi:hypothetical protein K439DRAFT_1641135 [Ramaria rubella]|nr:hypothetical protein K439DRAFT_1641135 [Ramaria rubella]
MIEAGMRSTQILNRAIHHSKSCHVRNFDFRSANLPPSSSPSTSPTRRTYSLRPTIPSESFVYHGRDLRARYRSLPVSLPKLASPHPLLSLYRTSTASPARRSSPSTHSSPIVRPSIRPLSPTKLTGACPLSPLSLTSTGASTASAPTYLRTNSTGTPLKPNYTGRKTFGPSLGFEGTPSCPKCGNYFAEQVNSCITFKRTSTFFTT